MGKKKKKQDNRYWGIFRDNTHKFTQWLSCKCKSEGVGVFFTVMLYVFDVKSRLPLDSGHLGVCFQNTHTLVYVYITCIYLMEKHVQTFFSASINQ